MIIPNDNKGDESDDLLANEDDDDPLEMNGKSSVGNHTAPALALAENSSLTDPTGDDDDDSDGGWSNGQPYGRVSHGDNR